MIKVRVFPCGGVVASLALSSVPPVMVVVLIMTGVTILRQGLQIYDRARIEMALGASCCRMAAFELENVGVMIEIIEAVHAIVTGKAIGAERKQVSLGEGNVHVAVAGLARV